MIPDWNTNYVCFSDLFPDEFPTVWEEVERALVEEKIAYEMVPGTKDIWARDYMPIQVTDDTFIQFTFNPDYLQRAKHLITKPLRLPWMKNWSKSQIILDGGNLATNGKQAILTSKVQEDNRRHHDEDLGSPDVVEQLSGLLKAEVIIVPRQPYEITGHVDGILSFLSEKKLLVNDFDDEAPKYGEELERQLRAKGFDIEWIVHYIVTYILRFRFPSAQGCYANFLRIGDVVLFPQFASSGGGHSDAKTEDLCALSTIERVLPECLIHPIGCNKLAREGGILHCIGMNYRRPELSSNLLI